MHTPTIADRPRAGTREILAGTGRIPAPGPASGSIPAWRAVGCFGLLLLLVSGSDFALTWYPLDIGRPEWEFGAVAASFTGLPLLAMAMAALLGAALGLRRGWMVWTVSLLMIATAAVLAAATAIFLLDVPIALRLAPAEVQLGIKKTIVKTLLLGTTFPATFLIAAVVAIRHHTKRGR